jgi:TonB family protein
MKKPLLNSFAMHLLVVVALATAYGVLGSKRAAEVPMEVVLSDVHVHHADASKPARPKPVPAVAVKPVAPAESAAPTTDKTEPAPAASPAPDAAWGGMNEGQRNQYLARLLQIISSRQYYPKAAILNEQEGVVKLRVKLGEGGAITSCEVMESSGHALLDDAAVSTLRKIGTLPLPNTESKGVMLVIPIRYEINPAH